MKPINKILCFFITTLSLLPCLCRATADHEGPPTSIVFATLGRSSYAFDIYAQPIPKSPSVAGEFKLTDGKSVNYNGQFPSPSSTPTILSLLSIQTQPTTPSPTPLHLVYVTERNGSSSIYLDALSSDNPDPNRGRRRSAFEIPVRVQFPLLGTEQSDGRVSMKDRPSFVGDYLVYVSTHEDSGVPRTSWTAVYSTHLETGLTRRLTPYGVADFSPAVSPSGLWTAVASSGDRGWTGEVDELKTDIYIFRTKDGSDRVKVVEHGGWPSWADESSFYFHRKNDDGWWSVYIAIIPGTGETRVDSVVTRRVTSPGLHAFTPAASTTNNSFIAVATRRPDSDYRHIEIFDLESKEFTDVTRSVSPRAHHYNPFISPDSALIGYHKCRGSGNKQKGSPLLLLENLKNPLSGVSIFRIDGSFPSFSPDGEQIAYVKFPGLYVVNRNGSGWRKVFSGTAFSTAWDPKRKGVVYTSIGPTFAAERTKVDVISIDVDNEDSPYTKLTTGGENNAFPSPSPDGKWVVFRSGRSGHKNLYIMDAVHGEKNGLYRLTEGPWTDTMCNWSPDGDWIAFATDRENPGSGSFEIYMVHPNGTNLRKVVQSGSAGRTNHPWFSPDGEYIVFTSDYAGVSSEPIANPHHYQPYGDIFVMRSDGSEIRRLTHNSFEDGTPTWGPAYIKPDDVEHPADGPHCSFDDCHWLSKYPTRDLNVATSVYTSRIQCGK